MSERNETIRSKTAEQDRRPKVECRGGIWKSQHDWKLEP